MSESSNTDPATGPQAPVLRPSRLTNTGDLRRIQDLFARNGYPRSPEEVAWIYAPARGETPHASIAEAGESTAALYVTVPAFFTYHGQPILGAQSLDTMVDAPFRGFGLFTKLATAVNEDMARSGVRFVYGFPNGNSYPGFVRKLGWQGMDPVPFLFRPINIGYVTGKVSAGLSGLALRIPAIGRCGRSTKLTGLPPAADVDALWKDFSARVGIARTRDYEYLHHRYERHPRTQYEYRVISVDGQLEGLIIYCLQNKHGGRIGYVMELMCHADSPQAASHLLADAVNDMRSARCDGVLAWCFDHSPHYRNYLRQLFLPLPIRLRPIELHFGSRSLSGGVLPAVQDRRQWYLSYSDSDTV